MNQYLIDVLINLFASAIGLILGAVISLMYVTLDRKTIKTIWGLGVKRADIYLSIANLDPQRAAEYSRPTTGIGELEAVSFLRESIIAGYGGKKEILLSFSDKFPETSLSKTVICIGGSKYNQTTKLFSEDLRLPYDFVGYPTTVIASKDTDHVFAPSIREGEIRVDYGMIIKVPNMFDHSDTVFLFRGTHTYGVAGAARLVTPKYARKLATEIKKSGARYWMAIVETRVHGSQVFPEIVRFSKLVEANFKTR